MRGLDKAEDLIRERGSPAQLCVYARGRLVLDESYGCPGDSQFFLFSAGKPLVALAVHLLARRGALALDDPVAVHWPEVGQRGKQGISIRHVLQHRGGLPVARGMPLDALVMTDWDASVRAIERAVPGLMTDVSLAELCDCARLRRTLEGQWPASHRLHVVFSSATYDVVSVPRTDWGRDKWQTV